MQLICVYFIVNTQFSISYLQLHLNLSTTDKYENTKVSKHEATKRLCDLPDLVLTVVGAYTTGLGGPTVLLSRAEEREGGRVRRGQREEGRRERAYVFAELVVVGVLDLRKDGSAGVGDAA